MARMQQTKNTVIPSWKVSWFDGDMSRSKAIQDRDQAIKFKELVEDAGDQMPPISVLSKHGLTRYADWVNPEVFVGLRDLLNSAQSDEEAVTMLRHALDLILDVSR